MDNLGGDPDKDMGNANDIHNDIPVNSYPKFIEDGIVIVRTYGWFILFAFVFFYYLFTKLRDKWFAIQNRSELTGLKKYDAQTNYQERIESMEASRRRMQAEHDEKAADYAERQKIMEEKKRQERIEDWERHQRGEGYRSKTKVEDDRNSPSSGTKKTEPKKKEPLRQRDYNPLTSGNTSGFRSSRRSGGG